MQNTPINNTPSQKSGSSTKISTYIGPYINNQRNGKGKLILPDQSVYEGNFKNNEFDGYGEFTSKNYTYNGNYINGKKNGQGIFNDLINNIIYEGNFKNDMKDGKGIETYADGSKYTGDFKENMKDGEGELIIILENGQKNIYIGQFKEDLIWGKGIYKYYDSKEYIGEWKNNEISGYGILIDENVRHIGYFEHDKKHGYGCTFHLEQGFSILGKWNEDKEDGFSIMINVSDIGSNSESNVSSSNTNNNGKILKIIFFKDGEIENENISEDDIKNFMESQEFETMLQLYKNKLYADFLQSFNEDTFLKNVV